MIGNLEQGQTPGYACDYVFTAGNVIKLLHHNVFFIFHGDIMTLKCLLHKWPFVRGIPSGFPLTKGQWCRALMCSLLLAISTYEQKKGLPVIWDILMHQVYLLWDIITYLCPNFSSCFLNGGGGYCCHLTSDPGEHMNQIYPRDSQSHPGKKWYIIMKNTVDWLDEKYKHTQNFFLAKQWVCLIL